jgi:lipoprotein NlpI
VDGPADIRNQWELSILFFLLGRYSEADLFQQAVARDAWVTRGRLTQANFYAGSVHLLRADTDAGVSFLEASIAQERVSFSEYQSSIQELRDLRDSSR